jgi:succinate-semialdehyde dehydrogenase/glutarate-semialdehyde dehydrogenase
LSDEKRNLPLPTQCYVGGEWIDARSGERIAVQDPGTGDEIGSVPSLGAEETRAAIDAAAQALPEWRSRTAAERSAVLRRWFELMHEHADELAQILTMEQGKPLAEARNEVLAGASFLEYYAEEGKRVGGDVLTTDRADRRLMVIRQPVGVVAAITPWNFPSSMIMRKVAPAVAVGCTTVVKPAENTPLSALALAVLAEAAGLPAGVLNVITGDARVIGAELTSSKVVRKLSFTGSTEVGKILSRQSADTLKRLSMELGGNAPLIVFEDADIDLAVKGAVAAKFRNAGQTCVAANRIYVQAAVYDEFLDRFSEAASQLVVAHGTEAGAEVGPLIDAGAVTKVEGLLEDAVARGGKVVTGGRRHPRGALYFEPTIVANATDDMAASCSEIFGPVAPVYRFETEDEVVTRANDTDYGLAAYIYANDYRRIWRVSEALEYGMVGVNESIVATAVAPFGGVKESGTGREGSRYGIEDYTELKYICLGGMTR